jgi:trigger factor
VQSEVSEISPIKVEVKVEVPWERVSKDLNQSYSKLAKTAKVRGFRPGKVPRGMVKKLFGKQVKAEVTGSLIQAGLIHAVEEHQLQIVSEPNLEQEPAIADGEPLAFTATIEVRPTIDAIDVDGLEIKHISPKATDEAVDEKLQELRKENADFREPEPMRGAKDGDRITVDFVVKIDGEVQEELGGEDREIQLGDDSFLDELEEGMKGMKPEESKDVDVPFPEEHPNELLRGKTATFTITCKALHERILPELDDELAKDAGDYETLDELKQAIRDDLQEKLDKRDENEIREKLIDAVLAKNEIEVPPAMVKEQQQRLIYEMAQFAQMFGQQMGPEMLEGLPERAERRVRAGLVLGALARLNDLTVDEDAVDAELQDIAEKTGKHIAKVRVEYRGERREQLESELIDRKIMAFLKEKATILEEEDELAAKADEADSEGDEEEKSE